MINIYIGITLGRNPGYDLDVGMRRGGGKLSSFRRHLWLPGVCIKKPPTGLKNGEGASALGGTMR